MLEMRANVAKVMDISSPEGRRMRTIPRNASGAKKKNILTRASEKRILRKSAAMVVNPAMA
jgi:hypothetical protein